MGNQIKKVAPFFDRTLVINDNHYPHIPDPEFKYLPPHCNNVIDCNTLDWKLYEVANNAEKIRKHTLNAFLYGSHAWELLLNLKPKNVMVAGYVASIDVVPTCLGLMDAEQNIYVHKDCIGDVSKERKEKALEYLEFIGIPILGGEINAESFSFFERQTSPVTSIS